MILSSLTTPFDFSQSTLNYTIILSWNSRWRSFVQSSCQSFGYTALLHIYTFWMWAVQWLYRTRMRMYSWFFNNISRNNTSTNWIDTTFKANCEWDLLLLLSGKAFLKHILRVCPPVMSFNYFVAHSRNEMYSSGYLEKGFVYIYTALSLIVFIPKGKAKEQTHRGSQSRMVTNNYVANRRKRTKRRRMWWWCLDVGVRHEN